MTEQLTKILKTQRSTKLFSVLFLLILSYGNLLSQNDYNIWFLGSQQKVDFNSFPKTVKHHPEFSSTSSTASICNPDGSLLFFTNGDTIWNWNGDVMDGGLGISGHGKGASIIVKKPLTNNLYYLFTSDILPVANVEGFTGRGIKYHLIDMSANSGMGKVIFKNKHFSNYTTGNFSVLCDTSSGRIWIFTHCNETDSILVHQLKDNNLTMLSSSYLKKKYDQNLWRFSTNIRSQTRISSSGKYLAAFSLRNPLVIYEIDTTAGSLNILANLNCRMSDALEFSPNEKYLYFVSLRGTSSDPLPAFGLFQLAMDSLKPYMNLITPGVNSIDSYYPKSICDMRLTPHGYILLTGINNLDSFTQIGVIRFPNERYPVCMFDSNYFRIGYPWNDYQDIFKSGYYRHNSYYLNAIKKDSSLLNGNSTASQVRYNFSGNPEVIYFPVTPSYFKKFNMVVVDNLCQKQQTKFKVISGSLKYYIYNFGDGNVDSSLSDSVFHSYKDTGTFKVLIYEVDAEWKVLDSFEKNIVIKSTFNLELGSDTLICSKMPILKLISINKYDSLIWSDGNTSNKRNISLPGLYKLRVFQSNGCIVEDSVTIDTMNCGYSISGFCTNENFELQLADGRIDSFRIRYYNNDTVIVGANNFKLENTDPDTVIVFLTFFKNGKVIQDSFKKITFEPIQVLTVRDLFFCKEDQLTVQVDERLVTKFEWIDGYSLMDRVIDNSGIYGYRFVDTNGCSTQGNIVASVINCDLNIFKKCIDSVSIFNFNSTGHDSVKLDFGDGSSITSTQRLVTHRYVNAGIYNVQYTFYKDQDSIKKYLSIEIRKNPLIYMPKDTVVCKFSILSANEVYNYNTISWGDDVDGEGLVVRNSGNYVLNVRNGDCLVKDTIKIVANNCDCSIEATNSFTPNNDGLNDVFGLVPECQVVEYNLKLFNRWGQKVFDTNEIMGAWDGTVMDKPAPAGIYIWVLYYKTLLDNDIYHLSGTVNIIR